MDTFEQKLRLAREEREKYESSLHIRKQNGIRTSLMKIIESKSLEKDIIATVKKSNVNSLLLCKLEGILVSTRGNTIEAIRDEDGHPMPSDITYRDLHSFMENEKEKIEKSIRERLGYNLLYLSFDRELKIILEWEMPLRQ